MGVCGVHVGVLGAGGSLAELSDAGCRTGRCKAADRRRHLMHGINRLYRTEEGLHGSDCRESGAGLGQR
jgi:hypothetical protein